MAQDYLFSESDWHRVSASQRVEQQMDVESFDGNRLLNTPVADIVDYFTERHRVEVPVLKREEIEASQREVKVDVSRSPNYLQRGDGQPVLVPGVLVEVAIPFTGSANLFRVKPTTFSLSPPSGDVRADTLILEFRSDEAHADEMKRTINGQIDQIDSALEVLRKDAASLNSELKSQALQLVETRRARLLANQNMVAALGYKLTARDGSSKTYAAPQVRQRVIPEPSKTGTPPYKPEPVLAEAQYEHILSVIEGMTTVMERSPSAFTALNEEDLRWHFLVQLNGHFEGQATGETFNHEGKTDILLRVDNKNIFIGECKFWSGPKNLLTTIDQILGYTAWRDTKTAIIVFSRNRDFTKVLKSIETTVIGHANVKALVRRRSESSWQYRVAHRGDPSREMILTVLAFDVPR